MTCSFKGTKAAALLSQRGHLAQFKIFFSSGKSFIKIRYNSRTKEIDRNIPYAFIISLLEFVLNQPYLVVTILI